MGKLRIEIQGAAPKTSRRLLRLSAKAAFAEFDYSFDAEVCVHLVSDGKIREINREQRNVDAATDVLSFPLMDFYRGEGTPEAAEIDPQTGCLPLGDMFMSLGKIKEQAKEYGHGEARECAYLAVHSMLHLLGFDHTDEGAEKAAMREKEEKILKKLGLERN